MGGDGIGNKGRIDSKGGRGGEGKEGIIIRRARYGGGSVRVVEVYVNNDIEEKLEEIGK